MKMFRGAAVAAAVAGSTFAFNAQAVNLATDGIGEVAIAPFYTVRDGWSTLINLTNTQNVPVVVKVRFHEAHNSRDVLDFNVALSAFDVFTGIVQDSASGPVFKSTDTADVNGRLTCTIPSVVGASTTGTTMLRGGYESTLNDGDDDEGQLGPDRLREGYVEFIVMGYAEGTKTGAIRDAVTDVINVGNAIEQHNCAALDEAFNDIDNATTADSRILETARQFGEPINALKFNFRLLNPARGVEAGNTATTWANFYNPKGGADAATTPLDNALCTIERGVERLSSVDTGSVPRTDAGVTADWDPAFGGPSCSNLITEQREYAFLEPSLNDAWPPVANGWDDQLNAPVAYVADYADFYGNPRGVDAMSATIMRQTIVNEWSNNPTFGVTTDWVVTQPTKSFYVDGDMTGTGSTNGLQAALNTERLEALVDTDGDACFEAVDEDGVANAGGLGNAVACVSGVAGGDLPIAPYENAWTESLVNVNDADACNTVSFVYYDRAEQKPAATSGGVIVSPAPPQTIVTDNICYESNVVTFNGQSAFADAGANGALNRVNISTAGLPNATSGWMLMTLDDFAGAGLVVNGAAAELRGLPVIGFNLKVRNFGSASANYASTLDHGYIRVTN